MFSARSPKAVNVTALWERHDRPPDEEDSMSKNDATPPRGDAAWIAAKNDVAKRNEAAYARGREERAARDAAVRARQVALERRDLASLPRQPGT